jgi:adenosylmethionine-8-amino-7-oxononanoate aminotransferase
MGSEHLSDTMSISRGTMSKQKLVAAMAVYHRDQGIDCWFYTDSGEEALSIVTECAITIARDTRKRELLIERTRACAGGAE